MKQSSLVFLLLLLWLAASGCAAGIKRDSQCLATLVPDYLKAEEDLAAARRRDNRQDREEAHARFQELSEWQDRVYRRLLTRLEERHMLVHTFLALLPGPGIVFYPIVHWNIRSVFWDGANPDAASDPITSFCANRLAELPNDEAAAGVSEDSDGLDR